MSKVGMGLGNGVKTSRGLAQGPPNKLCSPKNADEAFRIENHRFERS